MYHRKIELVKKTVFLKCRGKVLILIDETKLIGGYKAIVSAIPSRQRAVPSANAAVNLFEFGSSELSEEMNRVALAFHRHQITKGGKNRFAQ